MFLKDFYFHNWDGNIYDWCKKNDINFEMIVNTSEVLLFDTKKDVVSFLSKPENKTEERIDKFMNYNFTVKNSWVGNDIVIHSRRLIDYDLESDDLEIYILKYKDYNNITN